MKLKCRKCRKQLVEDKCLVDSHGKSVDTDGSTLNENCPSCSKDPVWYVNYEDAPQWVRESLDVGNWTHGKLYCPKCKGRLGSFNFVQPHKCTCSNSVAHPVWMIKSKVDLSADIAVRKPEKIKVDNSWTIIGEPHADDNVLLGIQQVDNEKCLSSMPCQSSFDPTSAHAETVEQNELKVDEACSEVILAERLIGLRKEIFLAKNTSIREDLKISLQSNAAKTENGKEIASEHICPICLDLYFKPLLCMPCKHIFCDPCARQLSHYSDNMTCPTCRQLVKSWEPMRDLYLLLKTSHPREILERRKEVKKLKINKLTLPKSNGAFWFQDQSNEVNLNTLPPIPTQPDYGLAAILCVYAAVIFSICFYMFQEHLFQH